MPCHEGFEAPDRLAWRPRFAKGRSGAVMTLAIAAALAAPATRANPAAGPHASTGRTEPSTRAPAAGGTTGAGAGELATTVGELLRLDAQEALMRSRMAITGPTGAAAPLPAARAAAGGPAPGWVSPSGPPWPSMAEVHAGGVPLAPAVPWAAAGMPPPHRPVGGHAEQAGPHGLARDGLGHRTGPASSEPSMRAVPVLLSVQGLRGEGFDHRRVELRVEDEVHVLGLGQSLPGGLRLQTITGACAWLQHPDPAPDDPTAAEATASSPRTGPGSTTARQPKAARSSCVSPRAAPRASGLAACSNSGATTRDRRCTGATGPVPVVSRPPGAAPCSASTGAQPASDPPLRLCLPADGALARGHGGPSARSPSIPAHVLAPARGGTP